MLEAKAVVVVMVSGCSFATMETPHGSPPQCTESNGAAVIDTLAVVATPFVTWASVASSQQDPAADGLDQVGEVLAATMIASAAMAAFATSAVYGYVRAKRCSKIKAAYGWPAPAVSPP